MSNESENGTNGPGTEEPNGSGPAEITASPIATGQINITDVLGLGKASENLKPVGKAVTEAFNHFFAPAGTYLNERASGAARRHEIKTDAKTLQHLQDQMADDPASLELVKARFLTTEIRRQTNIEEATLLAVQYAETHSADDAAQPVDEDFMAEWVDGVKDVSNKDVRQLWAKLLAEAPKLEDGRAPKPVLDLLKQFDRTVAQSFANFTTLVIYGSVPAVENNKFWESIGLGVDFGLLKDIGVIETIRGAETIYLFESWAISQSGTNVYSSLRLKAQPTIAVWSFRNRALNLARFVFSDIGQKDEDLGYQVLESNMRSFANDKHQHLRISIKMQSVDDSKVIEIAHPDNAFVGKSSDDNTSDELQLQADDLISEIKEDCQDMPDYALRVLAKFALEGRLRITSTD